MKKGFKWNRKGVSPVIATIIIVAIAIVMSIAVAYWMLGLGAAFTRYEKLEFTTGYAQTTATGWDVKLKVKNTGSATAKVDLVFFNAMPEDDPIISGLVTVPAGLKVTLDPGVDTGTVIITVDSGGYFKSGMSIELVLQTVAGRQYPKVIILQ